MAIVSTVMTLSATSILATDYDPANMTVTVIWNNNGTISETFTPGITVGNISYTLPSESLAAGVSVTKSFSVTGLTPGPTSTIYTICTIPIGVVCQTVNIVNKVRVSSGYFYISPACSPEPCNAKIYVTWATFTPATFIPTIIVNGIRYTKPLISLGYTASTSQLFTLPGLVKGTYTICPDPNGPVYGSVACLTVIVPASTVTAISMVVTPTTCTPPCNATVTVIWQNNGITSVTFIPTIKIDNTVYQNPSILLSAGKTTTQIFNVTGLVAGTYTVCPVPN